MAMGNPFGDGAGLGGGSTIQGSPGTPGGSYSGQYGPLAGQSQSSSYSPPQASGIFDQIGPILQQVLGNMNQQQQNPLGGQFQSIVGPILQAMQPYLHQQQTGLTDAYRAAGGLRDTGYGNAMNSLMGTQATEMSGAVMQQALPFIQAMMGLNAAPMGAVEGAARAFPTYQQQSSQQYRAPSGSGGQSQLPQQQLQSSGGQSQPDPMQEIMKMLSGGSKQQQPPPPPPPPPPQQPQSSGGQSQPITSTWLGANGNFVSGSDMGSKPWSPAPITPYYTLADIAATNNEW